jgi:hypothetical protein
MRRFRWIVLAAMLLAATAAVFSLGEEAPPPAARPRVRYPQWYEAEQYQRQEARATLTLPAAAPAGPAAAAPAPYAPGASTGRRDPLLVSLPVREDGLVVVFEANALRHSRLGERFIACLEARNPGDLARFQQESGIDPLKDVDRVAFLEDAIVLAGYFQNVRWDRLKTAPVAYGNGRIWHDGNEWLGAWGDGLIVLAEHEESVRRAIDQLEGRAPIPPSSFGEDLAYGEVYGVIPGASARRILGADERGIGGKLASIASRVELHVDAMQDVAAVVRVHGDDVDGLQDLAKTIGGALAVARLKAQAESDPELADLLEYAEVKPAGNSFSMQLAVPADRLERWFADCARPRAPAPGQSEPGPAGGSVIPTHLR